MNPSIVRMATHLLFLFAVHLGQAQSSVGYSDRNRGQVPGQTTAQRKELRARYPKDAWPEDPLTARAERRPTRRKR